MNTQHLQYLIEIERTRSVSQAAENLFIGQPNLSRILHEMEANLGFKIFERTSKGVRSTERGAIFLQHAKSIIRELERIDALGPRHPVENRLRICIPRAAFILDLTADYLNTLPTDQNLDSVVRECHARQAIEMLCTDMLVPKGHLLRKIDAAVDFTHIYELVEDLYCEDNGRPGCDPVVLFKLVLIQHLFGIRSLRQTMRDAEVNVAYRWFLGYTMSQSLPHFATISYAFCHRFTAEVIEGVFRWILEEVARAGYLSPEVVFVDGTHIKANANLKKRVKKEIPVAAKRYQEQLDAEIEADRAAHGKKPLKKKDDDDGSTPARQKTVTKSTTDPDSGVFQKGEHRKCFAYEAHTVCDRRGYVLETEVTPGNVHDSVAFDTVFERLVEHYPEVQVIAADAGYKTPWICKQVFDSGRIPSLPYKRPMTKKGNLPWYEYVYDEYYNCVLCPQNQILSYSTTNRDGNREYKSKSYICKNCPVRERCTENQQCTKTVTRHVWHDYIERAEDVRHSDIGKKTYALRSQTIERVFADAKEKHAMRYTPYRGLPAVTAWVKFKFAAMNLKKLAIHKWMRLLFSAFLSYKKPDCKLAIWLL